MQPQTFNYRNQLITIFLFLQQTADGMYAHAFQLALNGELRDMNDVLEDEYVVPKDLNYLKILQCPVITALAELIEDILILQESVFNINALSVEEVTLFGAELMEETEEDEPFLDFAPACQKAEGYTFASLLDLYLLVWQLANSSLDQSNEVIKQFERSFFDDDLCLPSKDVNVEMMLAALNAVLEKNRWIDYWSADDQRS